MRTPCQNVATHCAPVSQNSALRRHNPDYGPGCFRGKRLQLKRFTVMSDVGQIFTRHVHTGKRWIKYRLLSEPLQLLQLLVMLR
jgi:hypothetical protein